MNGEHYHVYNRGAHKALIFLDGNDYERFVKLLFVTNNSRPLRPKWDRTNAWKEDDMRDALVDIFAYCLMPNHFHIGLIEKQDKGIERFMHKLCTAYAMYYNKRYDHSGTIFQGEYNLKHIYEDRYLRYLVQYIHLNPFGIEDPEIMKTAKPEYLKKAVEHSRKYEYSSFKDYLGEKRPQGKIINLMITP